MNYGRWLCSSGEWFWKKFYIFYAVPNCCRTPIPKYHVLILSLHLSQGLRKWCLVPSNEQNLYRYFVFNIFKGSTWNKICSLACFKAKTEEKLYNKLVFPCTDQKPFCPFLGRKKILNKLLNFILGDCSLI